MCVNGIRRLWWSSGLDVDLSPLPLPKAAFADHDDDLYVDITVNFITSPSDYQIFSAFKIKNYSLVLDLIDQHKGVNAVDEWGQTMLMLAVQADSLDIVARLLNTRLPKVNVNMAKSVSTNTSTALFNDPSY
jgi:hypothetical protein